MKRRLSIGIAAGVLAISGIAGWYSVAETSGLKTRGVIPALPEKGRAGFDGGGNSLRAKPVSLAELENKLLEALDPGPDPEAGSYSGERLLELCVTDEAPELPGVDRASGYAQAWAKDQPDQLFSWLMRAYGRLDFRTGRGHADMTPAIFNVWTAKDPAAAIKGALSLQISRGEAVAKVIAVLRKADPARAVALAAENIEVLESMLPLPRSFTAEGEGFRGTWDFLCALPAGKSRDAVLARYFDMVVRSHPNEYAQMWKEMPEELRRGLVAADVGGRYSGGAAPAELEGLTELRREYVEKSADPKVMAQWLRNDAREWAGQEPAAAISWALEHTKGAQRVDGAAGLFSAGAAGNFEATLKVWQSLPDGVLRARAAGSFAAGAPAERKAEVEAMLQSLSAGDRAIANRAREAAITAEQQRALRAGMLERVRSGK